MAAKKELIERESEDARMKEYLSYLTQEVNTHKQEIESKQVEMEALQTKLTEKETLEHQLEQQMFVESSETEVRCQYAVCVRPYIDVHEI